MQCIANLAQDSYYVYPAGLRITIAVASTDCMKLLQEHAKRNPHHLRPSQNTQRARGGGGCRYMQCRIGFADRIRRRVPGALIPSLTRSESFETQALKASVEILCTSGSKYYARRQCQGHGQGAPITSSPRGTAPPGQARSSGPPKVLHACGPR